jgi:putative tricarboxylic transport membrane protein
MTPEAPGERARGAGRIRSPHDLAGGLFLVALAAIGYLGAFDLPFGQLSGIGSGLMPKVVAVLVGAFGVLMVAQGLLLDGDQLERWHLRGPVFVLGAVLLFAAAIRGATLSLGGVNLSVPPLGLVFAGPLAVVFSALADKETRLGEIVPFAVAITVASIGLFKYLLRLPIPVFPPGWGLS